MDDLEEGEVMEIEEQEQRKPEEEVLPTTASSSSLHMAETFLAEATRGMDTGFVPRVVLPGDEITELVSHSSSRVKIGNGLSNSGAKVFSCKPGLLRYRPPAAYWVDNAQKRYIPRAEDAVLGVVEDRQAEHYKVNIFGSQPALLPHLAFEGATKRNKPNLKVGSLVYCRVAVANKDMDAELSCLVTQGVKKDWMTGESTFGELKGGTMVRCSIGLCRQLLDPCCPVLEALGKRLAFEIAVGINGALWVNTGAIKTTVAVVNAIQNSEVLPTDQLEAMVNHVINTALKKN